MLASSLKLHQLELTVAEFYCPNCHTRRPYEVKPVTEVHIVCAIPLFGTDKLTHAVECQSCKNGFDPEILKPGNQSLFRLVAAARNQILTGISPGSLKVRLMSDGLKEELVDKIIMLALN